MTAAERPPVHVDVVLPEHVWARLHLTATARGVTIASVIAEAIVRKLAADRAGDPMDQILDELDRNRTQQRLVRQELVAEIDQLLTLGLNPGEICTQLGRSPVSLEQASRRADRPDVAARFYPLIEAARRASA